MVELSFLEEFKLQQTIFANPMTGGERIYLQSNIYGKYFELEYLYSVLTLSVFLRAIFSVAYGFVC